MTIPASVTKIEGYAFKDCKRLSKIQYNAKKCTTEESVGPFERAGIGGEKVEQKSDLTTADLFSARLTGAANCAERRRELLKRLNLRVLI